MPLTYKDVGKSPALGILLWILFSSVIFQLGEETWRWRILQGWFASMNETAPLALFASGVVCFLLAALIGAFRHLCSHLLLQTAAMQVVNDQGKQETVYLGTYVPAWLSLRFRLLTWVPVAIASLWAAGISAATPFLPPQADAPFYQFTSMFAFILVLRWGISAAFGRGLAKYALDQEEKSLNNPGR